MRQFLDPANGNVESIYISRYMHKVDKRPRSGKSTNTVKFTAAKEQKMVIAEAKMMKTKDKKANSRYSR